MRLGTLDLAAEFVREGLSLKVGDGKIARVKPEGRGRMLKPKRQSA